MTVRGVSTCPTEGHTEPAAGFFLTVPESGGLLALFLAHVQPEAHGFFLVILEPGWHCASNESGII